MKPEWITPNVKLAWMKWSGHTNEEWADHILSTWNPGPPIPFDKAMDLLHFVAQRTGRAYIFVIENEDRADGQGPDFDLRLWRRGNKHEVEFITNEHGRHGHTKTESPHHAALAAVDAMVENARACFA